MRYVVYGYRLEIVCKDEREARVVALELLHQAKKHPYDYELHKTAQTLDIASEPMYLITRSIPIIVLAILTGALLAI